MSPLNNARYHPWWIRRPKIMRFALFCVCLVRFPSSQAARARIREDDTLLSARDQSLAAETFVFAPREGFALKKALLGGPPKGTIVVVAVRAEEVELFRSWVRCARRVGRRYLILAEDESFASKLGDEEDRLVVGTPAATVYELQAAGFDVLLTRTNIFLRRDLDSDCTFPKSEALDVVLFRAASPFASTVLSIWLGAESEALEFAVERATRRWQLEVDRCPDVVVANFTELNDDAQALRLGKNDQAERLVEDLENRQITAFTSSETSWRLFGGAKRWEGAWIEYLLSDIELASEEVDGVEALWVALATDRSILVLNSHEHAVTSALEAEIDRAFALLAKNQVGLVAIDESHNLPLALTERFAFVIRLGFGGDPSDVGAHKKKRRELVVPLGSPFFSKSQQSTISSRRYAWGYAGRVQSAARAAALGAFLEVSDDFARRNLTPGSAYLLHVSAGLDEAGIRSWREGKAWSLPANETSWRAGLRRSLPTKEYRAALNDVIFVPSPGGTQTECYRTYEALEAGAIPVVATSYYRLWFGAPFPIVDGAWTPASLREKLFDVDLAALSKTCRDWWKKTKAELPRRVKDFINNEGLENVVENTPCDAVTIISVYANELPFELTFPSLADDLQMRRIAFDFARERGLSLGAGCAEPKCVVNELVQSMKSSVAKDCQKKKPRILVTGVPGSGVDEVASFLEAKISDEADITQTYAPYLMTTEKKRHLPPTAVLHVLRRPDTNYQHSSETTFTLEDFAHRWAAHTSHWHTAKTSDEDPPVRVLRYEDFQCSSDPLRLFEDLLKGQVHFPASNPPDDAQHNYTDDSCLPSSSADDSIAAFPPVFDAIVGRYYDTH